MAISQHNKSVVLFLAETVGYLYCPRLQGNFESLQTLVPANRQFPNGCGYYCGLLYDRLLSDSSQLWNCCVLALSCWRGMDTLE